MASFAISPGDSQTCSLIPMHGLLCDFCLSDQRFAHWLVFSQHPASFRFHLTVDTLAFGYILPTTGRIRDFHPLETCTAGRTKNQAPHISIVWCLLIVIIMLLQYFQTLLKIVLYYHNLTLILPMLWTALPCFFECNI